MQIVVVKNDKLYQYPFPSNNITNYWIKDIDEFGNERDLVAIENKNNNWYLVSNELCTIEQSGNETSEVMLGINNFIRLKIKDNTSSYALLYICNENDSTYETYELIADETYTIGKNNSQNIIINNEYVNQEHAFLVKKDKNFTVKAKDNNCAIYVNNTRVNNKAIENGDIIFIYGYKIIILNNYLIINNPQKCLQINSSNIVQKPLPHYEGNLLPTEEDDNATIYNENEYYSRSPRFVTSINEENIKIDNPPGKVEPDETPVLYTIGPMLTMSMSSIVSATVSVINLRNGNGSIFSALPAIIVSVGMLSSTLLWPTLMKRYNKKRTKKKEDERQKNTLTI